ncbi:uncharacterized protein BJ171DRAFT_628972, partial [Polychytrium aggregatum]|uniref:uncharacterized protein n=1 Tax=Polychytrium aggregatum TaxID=110093 RepID=UPI0022FE0BCA
TDKYQQVISCSHPFSQKRLYEESKQQSSHFSAICRLPIADCRLPIADCRLPSFNFRPPPSAHTPSPMSVSVAQQQQQQFPPPEAVQKASKACRHILLTLSAFAAQDDASRLALETKVLVQTLGPYLNAALLVELQAVLGRLAGPGDDGHEAEPHHCREALELVESLLDEMVASTGALPEAQVNAGVTVFLSHLGLTYRLVNVDLPGTEEAIKSELWRLFRQRFAHAPHFDPCACILQVFDPQHAEFYIPDDWTRALEYPATLKFQVLAPPHDRGPNGAISSDSLDCKNSPSTLHQRIPRHIANASSHEPGSSETEALIAKLADLVRIELAKRSPEGPAASQTADGAIAPAAPASAPAPAPAATSVTAATELSQSNPHPNRIRVERSQTELKALQSEIADRLGMLKQQILRLTAGGAIDFGPIRDLQQILEDLGSDTSEYRQLLDRCRSEWKRIWEYELSEIVREQNLIKSQDQMLQQWIGEQVTLEGEIHSAVSRMRADPPKCATSVALPIVTCDQVKSAQAEMLQELSLRVSPMDSARRVEAAQRFSDHRSIQRLCRIEYENEFKMELRSVVREKCTRWMRGLQSVDEDRQRKDLSLLKETQLSVTGSDASRC